MITEDLKKKVLAKLAERRELFTGSDSQFSKSIGVNASQYSRIKNGDTEKVLSEAQWISLARRLGVSLHGLPDWKTAETPVFKFITSQLRMCQERGLSAMLCDLSDIGKTYTARCYAETHRDVVYVDCSQTKTRSKLIRFIAKSLGAGNTGIYKDVYDDLVFCVKMRPAPLIILDEAGDLEYEAFLEVKALWNATEGACGWYMMGADGLREKIRRAIDYNKVGYAEIFSRFGKRYGKVIPMPKEEGEKLLQASAAMIIRANAPQKDLKIEEFKAGNDIEDNKAGFDVNRLLRQCLGEDNVPSLRRIYKEIQKFSN